MTINKSDYRYLELLKLSLIDAVNPITHRVISLGDGRVRTEIVPDEERPIRFQGEDWPLNAVTMIGYERLTNIQKCIEDVVANEIPGDLIETGVWRGGAVIFMTAVLEVLGDKSRVVYAADSYEGLPHGDGTLYPFDEGDLHHKVDYLSASLDEVKENFSRFHIPTERVSFLKGWFRDTLPTLKNKNWSIVRLDGDMYESSILGFECLYPKLSKGGFIIVDDYGVPGCHKATNDFLNENQIEPESHTIGLSESIYWKKS